WGQCLSNFRPGIRRPAPQPLPPPLQLVWRGVGGEVSRREGPMPVSSLWPIRPDGSGAQDAAMTETPKGEEMSGRRHVDDVEQPRLENRFSPKVRRAGGSRAICDRR